MPSNLTHNVPQELDFTDSYMHDVHDGERLFERFQQAIPADLEYDTLVGTGLSGTIAAVDLARRLGKKYLVVRKENDNTHSHQSVEGRLGKKWLFVDDFVDTGRTLGRVYDKLHMLDDEFDTEFVGVYEYKFGEFNAPPRCTSWCRRGLSGPVAPQASEEPFQDLRRPLRGEARCRQPGGPFRRG